LAYSCSCDSDLGVQKLTCPFCGIEDSRIGEWHYKKHQTEYLQRIAKALESMPLPEVSTSLENILYQLEKITKPLEELAQLVSRKVEGP